MEIALLLCSTCAPPPLACLHSAPPVHTPHFHTARYNRTQLMREVAYRRRRVLHALLGRLLRAWRLQARWQRKMMALVVQEWREYSRCLTLIPFRAWYAMPGSACCCCYLSLCSCGARLRLLHLRFALHCCWQVPVGGRA